ncbi:MAG: MBL fold metallo-hydrolase [Candidatus Thorarchaeota archaeon]
MEWYYILIILLGIIFLIVVAIYWLYKANFPLIPTGFISETIKSVKSGIANVFIYTKGSDMVVIDAGTSVKSMENEFLKVDIDPENITDVFITHSDPDHIGGLSVFSNANVYFGKGSKLKNLDISQFLENNEIVMVGAIKVQAISTPGHRRGHTSYLLDNGYLFSGDLLRLKRGKVKPFFKFISSDFDQLLESIRKVAELENVKMLLTSHTGYTTDFKKAVEKWENLT